jgi:hypothetical protein
VPAVPSSRTGLTAPASAVGVSSNVRPHTNSQRLKLRASLLATGWHAPVLAAMHWMRPTSDMPLAELGKQPKSPARAQGSARLNSRHLRLRPAAESYRPAGGARFICGGAGRSRNWVHRGYSAGAALRSPGMTGRGSLSSIAQRSRALQQGRVPRTCGVPQDRVLRRRVPAAAVAASSHEHLGSGAMSDRADP